MLTKSIQKAVLRAFGSRKWPAGLSVVLPGLAGRLLLGCGGNAVLTPQGHQGGGLVILVLVMGSAGCIDVMADSTV